MSINKFGMSAEEIKARLASNPDGTTMVNMKSVEAYLAKLEYRNNYNKRPDVKAKRAAYNFNRRMEEKATARLIQQLLTEKRGEA